MLKKILVYVFLYVFTIGIILSIFYLTPKEVNSFPFVRFVIILFATVLLIKYFLYMVISPLYDVYHSYDQYKRKKILKDKKYEPRVSVLVPAHNEESGIVTTLESLIKSTYKNIEIIFIDNASTDDTYKNVKLFAKNNINVVNLIKKSTVDNLKNSRIKKDENKIDVVCFKESKKGKGYALNKGISKAAGDIIVSIDADCYVDADAIGGFVDCFTNKNVMAAVGNVKIGNTKTLLGVIQYLEFLFSFYFKKCDSMLGSIYIIGGAAGAFRKEVFEKIGYYSVSNITEDIDLSVRIQYAGMKIIYSENSVVYTEGATDFEGLSKQRLRWKRGRLETFLQYRTLFFSGDKRHNKILSWFILPLAIFGDMQLSLELFFILFVYFYSFMTRDYSSFISGIIVVCSMFIVQIVFDPHRQKLGNMIFLAPIGWLLLYVSTFIEFKAFVKAFWGYFNNEKVEWQNWKRRGVFMKEPKSQ